MTTKKRDELVKGSVADIAKQTGQSIAQTFLGCEVVCIVDTSGSMGTNDSVGGKSRHEQACIELASLQNNMPGKIGLISFASGTAFCANGVPLKPFGGTDLEGALKFAKIADIPDSGIRFIVISDGQPDDPEGALRVAHSYANRIDVIYCGPETHPVGRDFLERLARASGGQAVTASSVKGLASSVQKLLAV